MPPNESSELHKLFTKQNEPFAPNDSQDGSPAEVLPEELKNRHVRRLEEKLQREREANIAMAARVDALSEAQKMRQEPSAASWEEKARRIYGNDKPENAAASDLLVQSIKEASEAAETRAYEKARQDMRSRQEEETRETATVQSYIEQVEDRYGVDFTSSATARERQQEFKDLWFKLSPKDAKGEVKEYADPYEVFEIFNSRRADPAKDFASRNMVRSRPVENAVQDDATTKYLRENGIIDPF